MLDATRKRQDTLGHLLLDGPPGLGKTTFALCIPRELGVNVQLTSGAALSAPKDIVPYLTNADERSVLFIDEIHRLPPAVDRERGPVDAKPVGRVLELTAPRRLAGQAVVGAGGKEQLDVQPARLRHQRGGGADLHAVTNWQRTGGLEAIHPRDLGDTHAAQSGLPRPGVVAQAGHVGALLAGDLEHGLSGSGYNGASVNREPNGWGGLSGRDPERGVS